MSEKELNNDLLINNVKKFVKLTMLVMLGALIVGGIGGWMVYENHSSGNLYGFELLIPVIIATIVAGVGLRIYRSKLFATKEEFKKATELFKQQMEAKNK